MEIFINIILGLIILSGIVMIIRYPKDILLKMPISFVQLILYRVKITLYFFLVFPFYCMTLLADWIWKTELSKSELWNKLDPKDPIN